MDEYGFKLRWREIKCNSQLCQLQDYVVADSCRILEFAPARNLHSVQTKKPNSDAKGIFILVEVLIEVEELFAAVRSLVTEISSRERFESSNNQINESLLLLLAELLLVIQKLQYFEELIHHGGAFVILDNLLITIRLFRMHKMTYLLRLRVSWILLRFRFLLCHL